MHQWSNASVTIPSLPEEHQPPVPGDDDDVRPSAIPQSLMTVMSILIVLALILGSASTVVALTDWGLTFAVLLGLLIALALTVAWFLFPARTTRR